METVHFVIGYIMPSDKQLLFWNAFRQHEWGENSYLPICVTDGGGYIKGLADPIIDGTWWPELRIELVGTNIVVDVCDMFDGPRFPYGLGDGAYEP